MEHRIILGLDISTHCTGISVVYADENNNLKPIVVTHLRPKIPTKIKGIEASFLKCDLFMEKLKEILIENKLFNDKEGIRESLITDVVIEEPLLSSNNQYTVATLLRYNGMVAHLVYKMLGIIPTFISSYDARMYGVPSLMAVRKYNKKGEAYDEKKVKSAINKNELVLFGAYPFDCAKKLILWNYVSEKFPDIKWVYDKNDELKDENFDASDSLICVMGYVNKLKYDGTRPEVVCMSADETQTEKTFTYSYKFCGEHFTKKINFPRAL